MIESEATIWDWRTGYDARRPHIIRRSQRVYDFIHQAVDEQRPARDDWHAAVSDVVTALEELIAKALDLLPVPKGRDSQPHDGNFLFHRRLPSRARRGLVSHHLHRLPRQVLPPK